MHTPYHEATSPKQLLSACTRPVSDRQMPGVNAWDTSAFPSSLGLFPTISWDLPHTLWFLKKTARFGKKCYVFIKDAHMKNVLCEQCCLSKDLHECSVHICLINNKCGEHVLPRGLRALPDAVLSAAMVTADLLSF